MPDTLFERPLPENLACCTPKYCAAAEVTKPGRPTAQSHQRKLLPGLQCKLTTDRSRYIERGCIEKKDWEACDKNCRVSTMKTRTYFVQ